MCTIVVTSIRAALNKWLQARCSSRKKSGVGPFPATSEELQCKLLAIRCQKPGLTAQSLLLAWQPDASTSQLFASPHCLSLSPCQGWQWTWEGRTSPLSSLPSTRSRAPGEHSSSQGTPHTSPSPWGTVMGLAPAVLQFNHPQVFKIKSIEIQRCLPSGERQALLCLALLRGDPSLPPAAALSPHKGSLSSFAPQRKI